MPPWDPWDTESPLHPALCLAAISSVGIETCAGECRQDEVFIAPGWPVIGHGIVGTDIPIMARLAKARRWSKR